MDNIEFAGYTELLGSEYFALNNRKRTWGSYTMTYNNDTGTGVIQEHYLNDILFIPFLPIIVVFMLIHFFYIRSTGNYIEVFWEPFETWGLDHKSGRNCAKYKSMVTIGRKVMGTNYRIKIKSTPNTFCRHSNWAIVKYSSGEMKIFELDAMFDGKTYEFEDVVFLRIQNYSPKSPA